MKEFKNKLKIDFYNLIKRIKTNHRDKRKDFLKNYYLFIKKSNFFYNLRLTYRLVYFKIHKFRLKHKIPHFNKKRKPQLKFNDYILSLTNKERYKFFDKNFILPFVFLALKIKNKNFEPVNMNRMIISYLKIFKYLNQHLNMVYKDFYFNCFIKKTRSNLFLTITNRVGDTILTCSAGRIEHLRGKKKKKKSIKIINFLIKKISSDLLLKNITTLYCVNLQNDITKYSKRVFNEFSKNNIKVLNFKDIQPKSHGYLPRQKKKRRI